MAGYDPSILVCITCSFEIPGVLWAGKTPPQLQPHQWGWCWLPINTPDPQGGPTKIRRRLGVRRHEDR